MPAPRDVQRGTTRLLSVTLVLLGLAMIISTLTRGGGVTAYGLLLGVLFMVAGVARLWLGTRIGSPKDRG